MKSGHELGQLAYEAAAKYTQCPQPWAEANQVKWIRAAMAVVFATHGEAGQDWMRFRSWFFAELGSGQRERFLKLCNVPIEGSLPDAAIDQVMENIFKRWQMSDDYVNAIHLQAEQRTHVLEAKLVNLKPGVDEVTRATTINDALNRVLNMTHKNIIQLDPVKGDVLPPIGAEVNIHLNSSDDWVEHWVVGYYVWPGLDDPEHFRIFVRVVDSQGIENARLLQDIQWEPPK